MNLYVKFKFLLFSLLLSHLSLFAKDELLVVKGFLGRDELIPVFHQIEEIKKSKGGSVVLQLSSSSGDFQEVFHLARELFELRTKNDTEIIVFIQGRAVGPAGVIPLLADRLFVTPFAAWGDISYGVKHEENWVHWRSMIKGLINRDLPSASILDQLVDAMIDPYYQLAYEGKNLLEEESQRVDPLILNTRKMKSLGLVNQTLTDEEFEDKYSIDQKTEKSSASHQEMVTEIVTPDALQEKLKKHIDYDEKKENLVGYLQLKPDQPIQQSTYLYFKFALEEFRKKGVCFVILDINTPGGEVFSSIKMVDLLQKMDLNYKIPIIAYIDNWAVSAGAMIAYACRFIFVNPSSIMGAAEPVFQGKGGEMESAPEKVNSALRAEFSNLAAFFGRNELIAQAMVDKEMILVIRNHEVVKLSSRKEIRSDSSKPDILITDQGKLLTLNSKQLIDLGLADYSVKETQVHHSVENFKDDKQMVTTWDMPIFEQPFLKQIPKTTLIGYDDWRINFFTILSNPIVASLLFIGLIIGFYIEINTPGFGIPGSIGLTCLALILLSSFSTEAINWIEIIILVGGLLLLAIELFVIPGFGVVGILGIVLTIIGLFALMLPGVDKLNFFSPDNFQLIGAVFFKRLAWLCGALIFSIALTLLLARFFSNRFFRFSKFVLHGEQEGFSAGILKESMPEEGDLGQTITPLRPSGKVRIGENVYDAVTHTGYIRKGVAIEVIQIKGSHVVVCSVEMRIK